MKQNLYEFQINVKYGYVRASSMRIAINKIIKEYCDYMYGWSEEYEKLDLFVKKVENKNEKE